MKTSHNRKAFTIVELVIVIAVIAILAAVLIPTFSGIVKKAHVSNDTTAARNLSMQLSVYSVDGKIKNESDLRDAINELMGSGYYEGNLIPQSANQGYHFWYDIQQGTVVVQTAADIEALAAERAVNPTVSADNVRMADEPAMILNEESDPWSKHFRYYNGFLMIDRGGSPVSAALVLADKLGTESYVHSTITAALSAITTGPDKDFAASALEKLRKTAIVAYGTFVEDAAAAIESVYVSLTAPAITDTNTVINNQSAIDVVIPSNIGTVDSYSMQFNADANLHIDTTEDELSNIFAEESASSTGGTVNIVLPEGNYTINGNEIIREDGKKFDTGDISSSSVVTDLTLSELRTNKLYLTVNPENPSAYDLYVAVDYTGTISLGVDKYYGNDAQGNKKEIIARGTQWEVANGNISYENGAFTVGGFANDDAAKAGTITAKIQDVTKTINVYGVKATVVNVDTSNNPGLDIRDVDQNNVTITLPYTPTADNSFNFKPSFSLNYPNLKDDITLDGEIEVSAGPMTFDKVNNKLNLAANTFTDNTVTTLSVSYNGINSDITYTVKLVNNADQSFEVNKDYVTTETYDLDKYYVGKTGAFKLSYLFNSIKNITGQTITVQLKKDGTTLGSNTYSSLDGELNLSSITETGATEISISIGGAVTPITVELVAGSNITAENVSSMPSGSDKDIVLLSDISKSLSTTMNLNNVYGNLHIINASTSGKSNNYWSSYIQLYGTMENTIVLGPVYPSVGLSESGDNNGWDGVKLVAANSRIKDSYLFGFRAPVSAHASGSTVYIENSVIEGGTYCNIHCATFKELNLTDVTTIQDASGYTTGNKKVCGVGIFCDTACGGEIKIAGNTRHYNWFTKQQAQDYAGWMAAITGDVVGSVYTEVAKDGNTHGDYFNTGVIQEFDSNKVSVTANADSGYAGHSYAPTAKITVKYLFVLKKYYYAWTYSSCGGSCSHGLIPEGWSTSTIRMGSGHNLYENYLTNREK